MKTRLFLFCIFLVSNTVLSQDTINNQMDLRMVDQHIGKYFRWQSENDTRRDSVKIFSLSPIHSKINKVNGFALGFGHYENCKIKMQKVNGLNVEASPLSLVLISFGINIPFEGLVVGINDNTLNNASFMEDEPKTYIKINGLNISTGGFMGGAEMNGVNICVLSGMNRMNGFSVTGSVLGTKRMNGVSICGIANITEFGNGLQLAVSNVSRNHCGVQIGLFNNSKNLRGVQFGLWNTNGKRKLPFVNWQFRS